jgi:G3E family GTPase
MSGVKESKELLESLIKAMDIADKVLEDGKVTLVDVRHVPALISALKPGLEGVAKIKDELAQADDEDLKELAGLGLELAMKLMQKLG